MNRSVATIGAAVFAIGASTTLPMPLFTAYATRSGGGGVDGCALVEVTPPSRMRAGRNGA